ncbi:hypothetical protein L903_04330 [Agrobacterium sp. JL28]|nr:hypothetical protein L903_04330 [Agrobacterium sp. JL28]
MQAQVTRHRKLHRLPCQIAGNMVSRHIAVGFDQSFLR